MGIIKELIDELSLSKLPLTEVLVRTKVLAHKLKNAKIKEWVDFELKGYPHDSSLPNYRVIECRVTGNVSNGFYQRSGVPLPIYNLPDGIKETIDTVYLYQSISTLEDFINKDDSTKMHKVIPMEFYAFLSKNFSNGYVVEYAHCEIDRLQIIQVLTSIKTKLLDFLMDIDDIVDDDANINKVAEQQADVIKSMFSNSVFGNNTTIVVGDSNTLTVKNIHKGNFKYLEKTLLENSVDKEDIKDLQKIIDTENPNIETKTFGNKVNEWFTKMIGKALDGTWKIGIAAAGKLLADALWAYYGGQIQN